MKKAIKIAGAVLGSGALLGGVGYGGYRTLTATKRMAVAMAVFGGVLEYRGANVGTFAGVVPTEFHDARSGEMLVLLTGPKGRPVYLFIGDLSDDLKVELVNGERKTLTEMYEMSMRDLRKLGKELAKALDAEGEPIGAEAAFRASTEAYGAKAVMHGPLPLLEKRQKKSA